MTARLCAFEDVDVVDDDGAIDGSDGGSSGVVIGCGDSGAISVSANGWVGAEPPTGSITGIDKSDGSTAGATDAGFVGASFPTL
jgi:hypothetical protein